MIGIKKIFVKEKEHSERKSNNELIIYYNLILFWKILLLVFLK